MGYLTRTLAIALVAIAGCGDDTAPPATPVPVPAIIAGGSVTATYPAISTAVCTLVNDTLDVLVVEAHKQTPPLHIAIRAYHGRGDYAGLVGPAATGGVTVALTDSAGQFWLGTGGTVVVTDTSYTKVNGTVTVTLGPTGTAAGSVDLNGQWACSIGERPATASPAPATRAAPTP